MNIKEEKTENHWNQNLLLWKDQRNWYLFSCTCVIIEETQLKSRLWKNITTDTAEIKSYKGMLWAVVYQEIRFLIFTAMISIIHSGNTFYKAK